MDPLARYHRQMLLPPIGREGQERLAAARGLIIGCGALGCAIAEALTRAGIGSLRIIDRDIVELTNLQRQGLFDEADAAQAVPKAIAAQQRLARINSAVHVDAIVDDFNAANALRLIGDVDLILDGLDNFETRYLCNDLAVMRHLPYIHGGAVGTVGTAMTVLPAPDAATGDGPAGAITWSAQQATPCLRCVFPEPPTAGTAATCDTAGVLGPLVNIIAAWQVTQAMKLILGEVDAVDRSLLSVDVWSNDVRSVTLADARDERCPCCGCGEFAFLDGSRSGLVTTLCGRGAVQVNPAANGATGNIDLKQMAGRLAQHGTFSHTEHLLRGAFAAERDDDGRCIELMLFPTGRAILKGVHRPEHARSLYARYIGS